MNQKSRPRSVQLSVVLREFPQIGRYRVRIVRTSDRPDSPPFLDLREWVRQAGYEGFTRKGLRLSAAEARALRAILNEVVDTLA